MPIFRQIFNTLACACLLIFTLQYTQPPPVTAGDIKELIYHWGAIAVPLLFGICTGISALAGRWNGYSGFSWLKFIFQGLPALVLLLPAIYWNIFLTAHNLFGINEFPALLPWLPWPEISEYRVYTALLSAWLGRILIDCIKNKKSSMSTYRFPGVMNKNY